MDLSSSSLLDSAPAAGRSAPAPRPRLRLYGRDLESLLASLSRRGVLIVTPNLDHLRLLARSAALRRAYGQADILVNDSRFLAGLCLGARALTVPGSELAPLMLARAPAGGKALVIGCDETIRADLPARYPHLAFSFLEPSMGFVRRPAERRAVARAALALAPQMVFVCTGAPQSELLAAQLKRAGLKADMLCCGSAFHFLAGTKARAPAWARGLGAEWLWRFVLESRTRARYLADALFLTRRAVSFTALRFKGSARFGKYDIGT